MPAPDADDLALITDAARGGGEIARRFYGGTYRRWDKGKGQPVTEADLAINDFLREKLTGARADYGWLSEESNDNEERLTTTRTFIVDPLDGTIAFLRGRPHFTVAIAVVENGRPRAAVVYNPITEECFCAAAGRGATLNEEPIRASNTDRIEDCRMLGSKTLFEHPVWSTPPQHPWPPMRIEQRNSLAYRLSLVGTGQFDAMLALSRKNDWDLAAGDLIVQEAGGVVTDHQGAVLRYNGRRPSQRSIVGAGARLHPLLLDRVLRLELPED